MRFVIGILIGLGLGILVGLLIAPQSGEETRTQIGEQGVLLRTGKFNEDIRARTQEALAQGRELYQRTKDELSQARDNN